MDSGSPAADGPVDGVGESRRWSDLKVYIRRRRGKKKGARETAAENPQPSSHETLATTTTTVELQSSLQQPPPPLPPPPAPPPQCERRLSSDDEASSRHRDENNNHPPETAAENHQISSLGPPASIPTTANLQYSPQRQPSAASPQPHQRLSSDDEASRHGGKNASLAATVRNPQASFHEPMATTAAAADLQSSLQRPAPVASPPQQCHHVSSGDEASSLNLLSPETKTALDCQASVPHQNGFADNRNDQLPQEEVRELRRKLLADLHQVRDLYKRLETRRLQLLATPFSGAGGGCGAPSQHSMTHATTPVGSKRAPVVLDTALAAPLPFRPQLSLSLPVGVGARSGIGGPMVEKEKRTPKANQYFHSSDFILAKDRLPPPASHKKPKSSKSKKQSMEESDFSTSSERKIYANAFKSCRALLEKLMKHKHGWVFNQPVDVEGLRLYDYFSIIKHPMDLGTVKSRLNDNFYQTPDEFAADVRLTFRNAMTYNPRGQDVHIMAEQLAILFEERWAVIDADLSEHLHQLYLVNKKRAPPTDSRRTLERSDSRRTLERSDSRRTLDRSDSRRTLERSGSTVQPVVVDLRTEQIQPQHFSRPAALKKPKANDLNKRDMTLREKQTLSRHLQSLPPEKMDAVIQIINKKNSALNLHDDEIEVDIDSVDAETLWELDRFVINYKKTLSKNKRKAELAMLAKAEAERHNQERLNGGGPEADVALPPPDTNNVVDENKVTASLTIPEVNNGDNVSGSSDSGNSSSDSGSSDSDSDSGSSSSYESDAAHSAGT